MPTYEERLQTAIAAIETLLDKHYDVVHGGAAATVVVDGGTIPSLLKLTNDIAAQIVGGYSAGYIVNVADNAGRTGATPSAVGQFLYQRDTQAIYYGTALTIGSWTIHPLMSTIAAVATAQSEVDALEIVVAGKMAKATYDPNNFGFCLGGVDVQVFMVNGTWTRPSGKIHKIEVFACGGGGGGGSGRRGAAATNRYGGGGGGAGGFCHYNIYPQALLNTGVNESGWETGNLGVTLGAGGTGGVGISTDSVNGNAGSAGTDTKLRPTSGAFSGTDILIVKGGNGGAGGTSTTGTGGAAIANGNLANNLCESSGAGGNGGTTAPVGGASLSYPAPGSGGGGGGITSANAGNNPGASGGVPGGSAIAFLPTMLQGGTPSKSVFWTGAGGGGGTSATSTVVDATNGQAGAVFGAGGGGGGAGINAGGITGAGGNGAGGFCMIITHRTNEV